MVLSLFLFISSTALVSFCYAYDETSLIKKVTETHLSFYWHENFTGSAPSSLMVASATNFTPGSYSFNFGNNYAFDKPVTLESDPTGDVIGKTQGIYTLYTRESDITMNLFLYEYQDSILSFLGRVNITSPLREVSTEEVVCSEVLPDISYLNRFTLIRSPIIIL